MKIAEQKMNYENSVMNKLGEQSLVGAALVYPDIKNQLTA